MSETWYKVLVNGKSFHGGNLEWSLPKQDGDKWTPGDWHKVDTSVRLCHNGLHVTRCPAAWWTKDATAYVVEIDGERSAEEGDKIAVQRCRLMRPLSRVELLDLQIFYEGRHEVRSGLAVAYNSSTVMAYDSSTVTAYGSSTVTACGSSTVMAYDSSTVMAYDSSTVMAYGSSTVTACGSSTVMACDSSTVTAYDSSTVMAYDSSTVTACDSSTIVSRSGVPTVRVTDRAVHVDQRGDRPVVNVAGGELIAKGSGDGE